MTLPGPDATTRGGTTIRDRHRAQVRRGNPPCGICGGPIDYSLKWPDPGSFEVDHIVAIDNGGADTLDNKQASHRRCNRRKWHRAAVVSAAVGTWVTHRRWW